MALGAVTEKIIILVGMFIATYVFSLIPIKLVGSTRMSSKVRTVVSMGSCFSGGVFLAACLLDLFPDVHEAMDHVLDEIENIYKTKVDYPVAEFVIVMGFFIVLIIEQVALDYRERTDSLVLDVGESDPLLNDRQEASRQRYGSGASSLSGISSTSQSQAQRNGNSVNNHPEHGHDHDDLEGVFQHSSLRAYLLLVALSFHSLFEGLAIGLQQELGQLISLFLAVIVHKAVMAFSLGLTLAQASLSVKQYLISCLIFSIASPIGMGLGIGLADMPPSLNGDIANSVLQGIAGGTFLYITFFEVLPHELNQPKNRLPKLFFVLLGFASICGLLFITH